MDFQEIKTYAESCLKDTPPPCVSVCPLGVDVRGLVAKVQGGRLESAYRAYRETTLFPRVVSAFCEAPCRTVCVRERLSDGFVDLAAIEREVVAGAVQCEAGRYALPAKKERVAILGGGLSALACASRLSSKGYGVTVFGGECGDGGRGSTAFETAFKADKEELFRGVDIEWRVSEAFSDAQADANQGSFDAVFEANRCGADERSVSAHIARGRAAASEIERRLRVGELSGARGGRGAIRISDSVCGNEAFTRKDALFDGYYKLQYDWQVNGVSEADRCPMCNCSACIDVCPMIRLFRQNPKRIAADLGVSLLPVDGKIVRVASRMMNSCNLCGLCTAICPAGVDTCEAIGYARHILKKGGHMAAAYHDFWMEDLAFSMSEAAYGISFGDGLAAEIAAPPVLFFPGCQLAASLPDVTAFTFDFILRSEPKAAMLLSCCGVPADWAADEETFAKVTAKLRTDIKKLGNPELLFACSTCKSAFAKALPELRGRLVYEWLAESDTLPFGMEERRSASEACAVFDPCASRYDDAGQAAVRALAQRCGCVLEELELSGAEAACCGFGAHIYPANPKMLEAILDERQADARGLPHIVYCANCRDLFLYKGMTSRHILELLFTRGGNDEQRLPSLTERRQNRVLLKRRYAGVENYALSQPEPLEIFPLVFADGIEKKMDRLLLLRGDVEKAVLYCESENAKAIDSVTGRNVGFYRERLVTIWVEYEITEITVWKPPENQHFPKSAAIVYNVYTHRMKIEE